MATAKMTDKQDLENSRSIEDMLTFLALAERADWQVPDLSYFDGAVPSYNDQIEYLYGITGRNKYKDFNKWIFALADELNFIRGAFLTMSMGAKYDVFGSKELIGADRKAVIPLLNLHLRGHAFEAMTIPDSARVVEARVVELDDTGLARSVARNHYFQARGRWCIARDGTTFKDRDGELQYDSLAFGLAVMHAYASRLAWGVTIRFNPSTPSVCLMTDSIGVREFFRFRELPEGKSRRDALAHWVCQHWRQDRQDPDAETYVREHLRGRTAFAWHRLQCSIRIPMVDRTRIDVAVEGRKRLSAAGLAKRLKSKR